MFRNFSKKKKKEKNTKEILNNILINYSIIYTLYIIIYINVNNCFKSYVTSCPKKKILPFSFKKLDSITEDIFVEV